MSKWKSLPCKRCGGVKLPGVGQMYCEVCKPIAAAELKERNRELTRQYKRRVYVPKPRKKKIKLEKPKNNVPADIRNAWASAHPNSIIRIKFPTPQSLKDHNWDERAA